VADKARSHRSELAVPGTNSRAMEKAPSLGADVVFLDLEDAVAPGDKEAARANVIQALKPGRWDACAISVRINGLDTHWCYRDIVDVVESCGDVLDTVLVPKVGAPWTWSSWRPFSIRSSSGTDGSRDGSVSTS
jgi:malyl-CoA/(S)-citramalyl-CoA lyase